MGQRENDLPDAMKRSYSLLRSLATYSWLLLVMLVLV